MTDSAPNRASGAWLRALEMTAPILRQPERTFPVVVHELAQRFGAAPALMSDDASLTYQELSARVNQYSRWAVEQGLVSGAVLALLMPNCPDYVALWLGVTRVGGVVALINNSLTGAALAHSINIVSARHLIVDAQLAPAVHAIAGQLRNAAGAVAPGADAPGADAPHCWVHGGDAPGFARLDEAVQRCASEALRPGECPAITHHDRALYIYTSGTSGLPKAVNVSHFRVMQWTHWFAGLMDTGPEDRLYNCLPMYHSIGGVVAIGAPLLQGAAVVIRNRFSARDFWHDIVRWDCTLFQYIGELCRYLVNSPAHADEGAHRLRLCCGNGLRADIWVRFKQRFRIPQILEYYASTEGNFSLYNCEEKIGAIGRIPPMLRHRHAIALIRCDEESGEPVRDRAGLCIRCGEDEVGEAIAEVRADAQNPSTQFEGYTDALASQKKLLADVFTAGDRWYRTGDLMRRDRAGFFYFVDRLGDTYRWKGENVATTEVAECLRGFEGITDALVYGVKVPGTEGRAGMATLEVAGDIDLTALRRHVVAQLPVYARPLFMRLTAQIPVTGTHKPRKAQLLHEGYDPDASADRLYFDDPAREAYVVLDRALFQDLQSQRIRV